jgi:hypothetical protein
METLHMSRDCFPAVVRVVVALLTLFSLVAPRSASAEPASKPRTAGMPVANGDVNAAVQVGNTLYIGGEFTHMGIASGTFATVSAFTAAPEAMVDRLEGTTHVVLPDGSGGWYVGGHLLSMGPATGKSLLHVLADGSLDLAFTPLEMGPGNVAALALHNGLLYVGGQFSAINGEPRDALAAVDRTTGALHPFDAGLHGIILALETSATTLYVGGGFSGTNGGGPTDLAAFDLASHTLTTWNPGITGFGAVRALQLVSTTLYVGGTFTSIGGVPRQHLAALDTLTDTNNVLPWDPQADGTVEALALVGPTLVVGGSFDHLGGSVRHHLGAYNVTTGALLAWAPNPDNNVRSLAPNPGGTAVYVGGEFRVIAGIERLHVAEVGMAFGDLSPWNPAPLGFVRSFARQGTSVALVGNFPGLAAQQRRGLAAIDLGTLTLTNWGGMVTGGHVRAMASQGNRIYIGGTFTAVNGVPRLRLAAMHLANALESWDPGADGEVNAIAATNSRIFIGGAFANAGGVSAANLIAVDPTTDNPVAPALDTSGVVHTLSTGNARVYVGGEFDQLAGGSRSNIGALSALDASLESWAPSTNGPVYAVDPVDSRVYIGGLFSLVNGVGRTNLAAVATADASLNLGFAPNLLGSVHGVAGATNSVFVGGQFTAVNGLTRYGGVTLTRDTGALRTWHGRFEIGDFPTSFMLTQSGVWAIGSLGRMGDTSTLMRGIAFFPDALPTLAPISNVTILEDHPAGISLLATDEVLPASQFGFRASSSNPSLIDASGLMFNFSAGSWSLLINPKPNAFGTATISVSMDDGLLFAQRQFQLEVTSVNDAPSIAGLANATILKNTVYTKAFTVTDVDTPIDQIVLSATSGNQTIVPNGNIVITGTAGNRTIQVTPPVEQTGLTTITVTATGGGDPTVVAFGLNVIASNTPPAITPITNQTTTMGVPVGPLSFTVTDAEGEPLDVEASSSNLTLVPQGGIALTGGESNRTITVSPAPGQAGVATITLTVTDSFGAIATTSFTVTVNGVPPGPPQNFAATVVNTQVTLTWQAPITGGVPTTYVLEGGTTPGGSDLPTTPVGLVTSYVATLPAGTYFVRVRAANAFGLSAPSNEITVTIASGLPSVPGAPTGLVSGVSGQFVTLYWVAPATGGQPTHYILEAGSATGQANLAVVTLASTATGVQFPGVPFGVYHLRVRAANAQGVGPASNEAVVTVGGVAPCTAAPTAPVGLTPTVQGALITLSWAPGPGSAPTAYRIRVGTLPGQVDLGEIPIDSAGTSLMATAPPGTYYVHLIAINACGISAPSNEVSLTVQNAQAPPGPVTGLTWFLGPNNTVTLQWQAASGDVTSYIVIAGSTPGAHDLAVVPTGTTATSLSVEGVGSGTYYVYVRATNGGGHGPASNGIVIVVP